MQQSPALTSSRGVKGDQIFLYVYTCTQEYWSILRYIYLPINNWIFIPETQYSNVDMKKTCSQSYQRRQQLYHLKTVQLCINAELGSSRRMATAAFFQIIKKHIQIFIFSCLKNTAGLMLCALNLYLKVTIIDKI